MFIQIFLVVIVGLIIVRLFLRLGKKEISLINFFLWLFFWLIALFVSLFPETTNTLAQFLGVGRGADLIIYLSLILIFYFIFSFVIGLRKIDQKISRIISHLSLEEKGIFKNQKK